MKRNLLQLCVNIGLASVIGVAGCAGTLTDDEQQRLWLEHTGGTGGGTGSMTSGSGGGGPMVDMCVVSTATTGPMHTCQGTGCHSSAASAAMLNLENDNLTKNYKKPAVQAKESGPVLTRPAAGAAGKAAQRSRGWGELREVCPTFRAEMATRQYGTAAGWTNHGRFLAQDSRATRVRYPGAGQWV